MTDQVRILRDRIGQQSGFLSPALIVLLLAVAGRLPEEEERAEPIPEESRLTLVKTRGAGAAVVTLSDGTEIPVHPMEEPVFEFKEDRVTADMTVLPPIQENMVLREDSILELSPIDQEAWDRAVQDNAERAAEVFGIPAHLLEQIQSGNMVISRDSWGRTQVTAFAGPEMDYMDGTWVEEIAFITDLYFGPNPFHEYPYRLSTTFEPISNGVRVLAILNYEEDLMLLGEIDFVRERVGYADPETGRIDQFVPLLPAHWSGRGSEGNRMAQQARDYRPYSGYCTPHRDTLTAPHCQCADCRGARLYEPASLREGRRQRLASIYRPDGTPVFEEA